MDKNNERFVVVTGFCSSLDKHVAPNSLKARCNQENAEV